MPLDWFQERSKISSMEMKKEVILLVMIFLMPLTMSTKSNHDNHNGHSNTSDTDHIGIHVAAWNAEEVGDYVSIIIFVIFAGLAKVVFHHAHFLSSRLPESW